MAITPDAVSTNEEMVESFLDRVYHPYKKQIWAGGILLFGAIVAYLAMREYQTTRNEEMWARYREATNGFELSPIGDPDVGAARKQLERLDVLMKDFPDDSVTPWAMVEMAEAQVGVGDFEKALQTIDELKTRYRDFPLNHLAPEADGAPGKPLVQTLEDAIRRQKDWASKHAYVHHWPSEERIALVETTLGSFWLGFYSEANEAPKHVEAFIERAKRGDYNGTQVYTVIQSVEGTPERFECGSKASGLVDRGGVRDPAEHDRDEPTDTIEPEDTRNTIHHEFRVVSAVKMDSGESATRFLVVAKRNGLKKMNGASTPFAAVLDREKSLETIEKIGRAPTYATNAETKEANGVFRMRDHPYPAVYIRRVTIFSKEKIEDGHTWDTARVATDKPEPWETGLVSPKPEEFTDKKPEDGATPPK
jgi:cyclophilin family peptidyl-prolyl cis-trans isomerase